MQDVYFVVTWDEGFRNDCFEICQAKQRALEIFQRRAAEPDIFGPFLNELTRAEIAEILGEGWEEAVDIA